MTNIELADHAVICFFAVTAILWASIALRSNREHRDRLRRVENRCADLEREFKRMVEIHKATRSLRVDDPPTSTHAATTYRDAEPIAQYPLPTKGRST